MTKEERKAYNAAYVKANKDKLYKAARARYYDNREDAIAYSKEYSKELWKRVDRAIKLSKEQKTRKRKTTRLPTSSETSYN